MRARRTRTATLVAALCLTAGIGACGGDDGSEEPRGQPVDLVVGDIVPLTGPAAGLGVSAQKAAQLAVEEINDAIRDAEVEHTVEIVHQDEARKGVRRAAAELRLEGASCVLGPWSSREFTEAIEALQAPQGGLLISPQVEFAYAGPPNQRPVVDLPALGPQETLSSESPDERDPSAAFARLYVSTDPPIGPPHTSDARQFDATIACYLAAVAARSSEGPAMSAAIRPPEGGRRFTWLELGDAVRALEEGTPVDYAGITARIGLRPLT